VTHQPVATAGAVEASRPEVVDREAIKALIGSALGYAMDGFDLLILGFMLKAIATDLALTQAQAASLVTATLIGAVLGGIGFGMLSDRLGRVRVLTWTIVIFAVFTGLCGLAQGYYDLLLYRTLAGLGLGGEFGIGMALVAEAWPASMRARSEPGASTVAPRLRVKLTARSCSARRAASSAEPPTRASAAARRSPESEPSASAASSASSRSSFSSSRRRLIDTASRRVTRGAPRRWRSYL